MISAKPRKTFVSLGYALMALPAAVIAAGAVYTMAQSAGRVQAAELGTTAPQQVYELGDVYLPGSRVYVFVGKTGLGHEHGVVGQIKQGRIRLDSARDAGQIIFDMGTFTADTLDARKYVGLQAPTDASTQQQVTANMLGAAILDVARFPTASFTIKEILKHPQPSQRGLSQYQFNGDFSLHGVSRPIQIVTEVEEQGDWVHLRGGFTMLQSQFGIKPFTKAFGAIGVTDQLRVWGDIWIAKQRHIASKETIQR